MGLLSAPGFSSFRELVVWFVLLEIWINKEKNKAPRESLHEVEDAEVRPDGDCNRILGRVDCD